MCSAESDPPCWSLAIELSKLVAEEMQGVAVPLVQVMNPRSSIAGCRLRDSGSITSSGPQFIHWGSVVFNTINEKLWMAILLILMNIVQTPYPKRPMPLPFNSSVPTPHSIMWII